MGMSCDILRAAHSLAPANAGKKRILRREWTMSVAENAFYPFEYFWTPWHSRPSGQPVFRGVRLDRAAVSLGVVREACVSTGSCTERALVPSDFAHSAMLAVPTGGAAHEIVIAHPGLLRRTTDGPGTLALQHPPLRIMLPACCPTASYQGLLLARV